MATVTETQIAPAPLSVPNAVVPRIGFVLSAGRTGTVFLTHLLHDSFPNLRIEHEPFPGRYELVLGNLRNDTGWGGAVLRRLFTYARTQRMRSLGDRTGWIEINPLLCPLIDLLPQLELPLHVVHMVREPASWAKSIATFRASRRIRPFFHLIPFGCPYPTPRPAGWSRLSALEKQLWRWRFCNERIAAHREHYASYQVVRYEDLFGDDRHTRMAAMTEITNGLGLPAIGEEWLERSDSRVNAAPLPKKTRNAPKMDESLSVEIVRSICGDLMQHYGYE